MTPSRPHTSLHLLTTQPPPPLAAHSLVFHASTRTQRVRIGIPTHLAGRRPPPRPVARTLSTHARSTPTLHLPFLPNHSPRTAPHCIPCQHTHACVSRHPGSRGRGLDASGASNPKPPTLSLALAPRPPSPTLPLLPPAHPSRTITPTCAHPTSQSAQSYARPSQWENGTFILAFGWPRHAWPARLLALRRRQLARLDPRPAGCAAQPSPLPLSQALLHSLTWPTHKHDRPPLSLTAGGCRRRAGERELAGEERAIGAHGRQHPRHLRTHPHAHTQRAGHSHTLTHSVAWRGDDACVHHHSREMKDVRGRWRRGLAHDGTKQKGIDGSSTPATPAIDIPSSNVLFSFSSSSFSTMTPTQAVTPHTHYRTRALRQASRGRMHRARDRALARAHHPAARGRSLRGRREGVLVQQRLEARTAPP